MADDSQDPQLDHTIHRALAGSAANYDALLSELRRRLREMEYSGATPAQLQAAATDVLLRFIDPLAGMLADSSMAGWFRGAGEVAGLLSPGDSPFSERRADASVLNPVTKESSLPPRAALDHGPTLDDWDGSPAWLPVIAGAVADLRSRRLVTRAEFDSLDDWARGRAFTIAGAHTSEAIESVRDAIADAVQEGTGARTFIKRVSAALETSPLGPGRLESVFRTNVSAAYTAGMDRIADHPIVAEQFPYMERMPIRDTRLTGLCDTLARSGLHGTAVFRADDPVAIKYAIPTHYQCRCGRRLLRVREAAEKGIKEAQEWLASGRPPTSPAWVPEPDLAPEDRKLFESFRAWRGAA